MIWYNTPMIEQSENLIDTLTMMSTLDDLRAALPSSITEKLGEGDKGVNRTLALLVRLAPFAPEPATFDRSAFDAVVAFDEEANQPLSQEESQKMIDVALEAGFLKKADTPTERYMSNPQIEKLVNRLFEE